MSGWVAAISVGLEQNWDIAKAHSLWGTAARPGQAVEAGDDVFFWLSGAGWLAHGRATTAAREPRNTAEVPWPNPTRYRYIFGLDVVSEPATPIDMTGAEATTLAGLQSTIRLGQFPRLTEASRLKLMTLFGGGESDLEDVLERLVRQQDFAVPPGYDDRDRAHRQIALRRGQQRFRQRLVEAYGGVCCVTRSSVGAVLEAAHIRPYRGPRTNDVRNGLLLRADIHTLFDLHLVTVLPAGRVRTAPDLAASEYADLDGGVISHPTAREFRPDMNALEEHNDFCDWLK